MTDPIPVLPLEYAPPMPPVHTKWRRIARVCALIAWPCCVVAWGLILSGRVETVLFTGPVIFILGVLTLLGGVFNRDRWFVVVGGGHCAVCVLFLVLVNAFHWSPREARFPFMCIGAVYTLAATVPTIIAMKERPSPPLA
jgi:hypothetical protein